MSAQACSCAARKGLSYALHLDVLHQRGASDLSADALQEGLRDVQHDVGAGVQNTWLRPLRRAHMAARGARETCANSRRLRPGDELQDFQAVESDNSEAEYSRVPLYFRISEAKNFKYVSSSRTPTPLHMSPFKTLRRANARPVTKRVGAASLKAVSSSSISSDFLVDSVQAELATMLVDSFDVASDRVRQEGGELVSSYGYQTTEIEQTSSGFTVRPVTNNIEFRTKTTVPKLG